MSLFDIILGLSGLPSAQIEEIDRQLPGFARIAAGVKQAEPILTKAKPLLDQLEPLIIGQLWPIVVKEWPDIVAATPAAEDLIDLANSREGG